MISIAICDDELNMRACLKKELEKVMESFGESIQIEDFSGAQDFYARLTKKIFDLLFLDIEMPNINGFSLAKELQKSKAEITIIFVSSHENLVFDTYEYEAFWFVRKRTLESDLKKAIKKYLDRVYYERKDFIVKVKSDSFKILYKDIFYFESYGHDILIKTESNTYKMGGSLKKLEEEIAQHQFIRIHKSFLVNIKYIYSINSDTVTLTDKSTIPLSKERRAAVRKIYFIGNC